MLLVACQEVNRPEKPEDLIPRETMVDILTESYTDNAARSMGNKVLREKGIRLDSLIYAKYQIDSLQFVKSHAYYASEINDYIDMLESVERQLELQKQEVDTLIEQERKLEEEARDSSSATPIKTLQDSIVVKSDSLESQLVEPVQN